MYIGKRQKFDWVFVLAVGDAVMVIASTLLAAHSVGILPSLAEGFREGQHGWLGDAIVYVAIVFLTLSQSGYYSWEAFNHPWFKLQRLVRAIVRAGLYFWLLEMLMGAHRPDLNKWLVSTSVMTVGLVFVARLLLNYLIMDVFDLVPEERIAFVGWTPRLERVLKSLQTEMGRFQTVLGYFEMNVPAGEQTAEKGFTRLGKLRELEAVHNEKHITLLLLDESTLDLVQLQELAAVCSRSMINFRMIPAAFDILSTRLTARVVAGVPLMGIQGVPFDLFHNRLAKRCVDIVGSIIGLILSAPIILVCAILIKRESPGPVFYRQVRLGLRGRTFEIIKLRSMKLDAESVTGAKWAVENDPRRLKIGAFLRKWNLDETPQFWNVLKGEMSLVGPRPERPQFVNTFSQNVRHYNLRHNCMPGVTSWAAVHGLRGNTSLTDRLDYDLFYFENWSLWLDFKTMFMTLLPPKNAY